MDLAQLTADESFIIGHLPIPLFILQITFVKMAYALSFKSLYPAVKPRIHV